MKEILAELGLTQSNSGTYSGEWSKSPLAGSLTSNSPIDGAILAEVWLTSPSEYEQTINDSYRTFLEWRELPAPKRGEVIREIGLEFRRLKTPLAKLITLEMGKILAEGEGEVQEAIDIADFAVGLSRQLYGLTMHSERFHHRMYEQWHPLGAVGVISAFNFPVAVWAWNAFIAAVCGNTVVWKPSEITPLSAIASVKIAATVAARHGFPGLFTLVTDQGPELGRRMAADSRLPLISATGSCAMGKSVAEVVGRRLGRSLLELGGNNAIIILEDANLDLALRGVTFGAVGTAGQRCTSTRRILVQRSIQEKFTAGLLAAYGQVKIGNPLQSETLMGPLVHARAVESYLAAVARAEAEGGKVLRGGKVLTDKPSAYYVEPTIVLADRTMSITKEETFAPILYVIPVDSLAEAIEIQNDVPQGLSSAIFTDSLRNAEHFLSHLGSDCGIANVNIGTSGAEIGGAFGGEKETGGGRESGSDSWRAYMRRQTTTINWSSELPLAQGIKFG